MRHGIKCRNFLILERVEWPTGSAYVWEAVSTLERNWSMGTEPGTTLAIERKRAYVGKAYTT